MTTLLYTHPSSLAHDTGPGHPEQQARAKVIYGAIERIVKVTPDPLIK